MKSGTMFAGLAVLSLSAAGPAAAATATLHDANGERVGTVDITETPNGVLFSAELNGLPPGAHGFHIHETGKCDPDFGAAGGHLVGAAEAHGFEDPGGPHAGDMPNIHIADSGMLSVEVFNPRISFEEQPGALFDDDGSALVIHANADDYESQPSGDAGDRIACAVIEE